MEAVVSDNLLIVAGIVVPVVVGLDDSNGSLGEEAVEELSQIGGAEEYHVENEENFDQQVDYAFAGLAAAHMAQSHDGIGTLCKGVSLGKTRTVVPDSLPEAYKEVCNSLSDIGEEPHESGGEVDDSLLCLIEEPLERIH